MAAKLVHAKARTRDRVPFGKVMARCGMVVSKRMARSSGVTCSLCRAVIANLNDAKTASRKGGK